MSKIREQDIANDEIERLIIGAVLHKPDVLDMFGLMLQSENFYNKKHQKIIEIIKKIKEDGTSKVLPALICERARTSGDLLDIGGNVYLQNLMDNISSDEAGDSETIGEYAKKLTDLALRRNTLNIMEECEQSLVTESSLGSSIDKLYRGMIKMSSFADYEKDYSSEKRLEVYFEELQNRKNLSKYALLTKRYAGIDNLCGGFFKKDYVIIGGRPSNGKTTMALNLALDYMTSGRRVLLYELEMSEYDVYSWMIAMLSNLSHKQLRRGEVDEKGIGYLISGLSKFRSLIQAKKNCFLVKDKGGITIEDIWLDAKSCQIKFGKLDLIIIDHAQFVKPTDARAPRTTQVGHISKQCKFMGKDLDTPIFLISQLSRASERRKEPVPLLSDLRETGDLEQDADHVLMMHRPYLYLPDEEKTPSHYWYDKSELYVRKTRFGDIGKILLTGNRSGQLQETSDEGGDR